MEGNCSAVEGLDEIIAGRHIINHNEHDIIKISNVSDGKWQDMYSFVKEDSLKVQLKTPLPFSWKGKDYVTFVQAKWSSSPPTSMHWLNLYNLTENRMEWTSDTIPLEHPLSGTPGVQPEFEDGQILLANDAIYSYNVEDGSLEWWKWYGNTFLISTHLTTANGMVYGNNNNQYMVGLDVHTGQEKFRTTTGGSASKIVYHDGKCHITSVTNSNGNRLMVIDGKSGEVIHDEPAPFREEDRDLTFDIAITVDPETDWSIHLIISICWFMILGSEII